MSYTLDPGVPLVDAVRAVARDQIDGGITSLEGARSDLEEAVGAIEGLAHSRSRALRNDALQRAPSLFIEKPKALARRLAGQWSLVAA